MSLINDVLKDLGRRDYQFAQASGSDGSSSGLTDVKLENQGSNRRLAGRISGVSMTTLLVGLMLGGAVLLHSSQTSVRAELQSTNIQNEQQSFISDHATLISLIDTDKINLDTTADSGLPSSPIHTLQPRPEMLEISAQRSSLLASSGAIQQSIPELDPIGSVIADSLRSRQSSNNASSYLDKKLDHWTEKNSTRFNEQIAVSWPKNDTHSRFLDDEATASHLLPIANIQLAHNTANKAQEVGQKVSAVDKKVDNSNDETRIISQKKSSDSKKTENVRKKSNNTTKKTKAASEKTRTTTGEKNIPTIATHSTTNETNSTTNETNDSAYIQVTHRPLSEEQRLLSDFHVAAEFYKAGNYTEAERLLKDLLANYDAQHNARLLLARLYVKKKLDGQAELVLSNGLLRYPQHVPYVTLFAQILAEQGRYNAAIDALQNALPGVADNADFHALLAGIYQRTGNSAAAIENYRMALQLEPEHGEWWMGLGISSEQAGDRNIAVNAYNEALIYPLAKQLEQYIQQRLQQLSAINAASIRQTNE